jgi:Ser-tRNA(Ala) deacylase AlaX
MNKQFDPRMHTAEHILNRTMVLMFDRGRSFSAHIEKKKSKCDYRFDRSLTDHEIEEIAGRVNEAIGRDLEVIEEYIPRDRAEMEFDLERLPDSAGETIRIVRVGDYDACPCIGPHVQRTSEIGRFRIISATFEDGVLRIRFKI